MDNNNNLDNFIFNSFLKLTSNTYPYGFEDDIADEMKLCGLFPMDIQKDKHGNYFYKIGNSRTIFTSHLDTACRESTSVTHVIEGNMIKTDGRTILGADDKAGVSIMLYLMKNKIPGLYYFFIGEEVGCVGSGLASKYGDFKGKYDRVVSFDRRGLNSVITYQSSTRCCSDKFALELASELNKSGLSYERDSGGIYTDSAEFVDIVPECTNLSVGYYGEHTVNESQDIDHLKLLADACLLVNWEGLSTNRDITKKEYKQYSGYTKSYVGGSNSWNGGNGWRSRDWGYPKSDKGMAYGLDDDFYDEDETKGYWNANGIWTWITDKPSKTSKTRRKKIKPKKFIDSGGELMEVTDNKYTSYYDWIITKFLDSRLSFEELDIIKDQYLDLTLESDRKLYDYLIGYISEYSQ